MGEKTREILVEHGGKVVVTVSASVIITLLTLCYHMGGLANQVAVNKEQITTVRQDVKDGFAELRGILIGKKP